MKYLLLEPKPRHIAWNTGECSIQWWTVMRWHQQRHCCCPPAPVLLHFSSSWRSTFIINKALSHIISSYHIASYFYILIYKLDAITHTPSCIHCIHPQLPEGLLFLSVYTLYSISSEQQSHQEINTPVMEMLLWAEACFFWHN